MKNYKIAVTWEVCGEIKMKANSLKEAIAKAETESDEIKLPEASYVDGSFRVDHGMSEWVNQSLEEKESINAKKNK